MPILLPARRQRHTALSGQSAVPVADREAGMSAVETRLKGAILAALHKSMHTNWAHAETPAQYVTIGLDSDLNRAAKNAAREILNFTVENKHIIA